jgi:hypothetical protein
VSRGSGDGRYEKRRRLGGLDPRLSKAVSAHASAVSALSILHSLRTRGLRRTLLFATLGSAIPVLGEHLAVNVSRCYATTRGLRSGTCRWPSPSAGTTAATGPSP